MGAPLHKFDFDGLLSGVNRMKNVATFQLSNLIQHLVLLLALMLSSCSGGGGDGGKGGNKTENNPPIGDMSGTWQVTGTDTSSTTACDSVGFDVTATIVQSGNDLNVTGFRTSSLSGTISGDQMSFTGSYSEDGGVSTISKSNLSIASDCNQFTGKDSWSWTDGSFSCSGTSTYTGTRLTGSGCGGRDGDGNSTTAFDTTFGTNGKVATNLGGDDIGNAVAIDSSDRIIVAGLTGAVGSGDFAMVRYDTDGALDSTFGAAGRVITNLGADDRGRSVAIDATGKIVMGGDSLVSASDFAVARYDGNGTLDSSFNGSGYVTTDFNNSAEPAMNITIDQNGKIVAAGFAHNGTDYDFALARYKDDGSLDASFGTNGLVTTDLGGDERISAVAIDSNGKIVVVGRTGNASDYNIAFVRYSDDGTLDTTFGASGIVTIDFGTVDDRAREIAFDSDDKLVIVGKTGAPGSSNFVVMRYNNDGLPDTTFGTNGVVITDIGGDDRARDIVIDPNGKILIIGTSDSQGGNDFAVLRYNSDSTLDTTFGVNGIATVDFGGDDRGVGIALDSNNMIIVAGRSDSGSGNDFVAARLLP